MVEELVAKTVERDAAPLAHAEIDRFALLAVWWSWTEHVFVVYGEGVDVPDGFDDGGGDGVESGEGIEVDLVIYVKDSF